MKNLSTLFFLSNWWAYCEWATSAI